MDWRSPYEGLPAQVHVWDTQAQQLELIATRIEALIAEGFAPDQILLLSMHGRSRACFSDLDVIGGHRLRKFTGGFTDSGEPLFTAGQLEAETLYRFKGNQRPAVIVVDLDLDGSDEHKEWRLVYCALTRATVACEVLVSDQSSWADGVSLAV